MTDHDLLSITIPMYQQTRLPNTHGQPENGTGAHLTGPQAEQWVGHPSQEYDEKNPPEAKKYKN